MTKSFKKYSIGTLRPATNRTKERSPNLIGPFVLLWSDYIELGRHFQDGRRQEVTCSLAGWFYDVEGEGKYIRVQLSPPYVKKPVVDATFEDFFKDSDSDDWEDDPSDR